MPSWDAFFHTALSISNSQQLAANAEVHREEEVCFLRCDRDMNAVCLDRDCSTARQRDQTCVSRFSCPQEAEHEDMPSTSAAAT